MSSLSGQYIDLYFGDLLQVSNAGSGADATLRSVESGLGTASALQLSTTAVNINGTFTVNGSTVTIPAAFTISGAYAFTGTLTGTTTVTFPTTGLLATTGNKLSDFAATTSLELKNTISDETGSGALVFGTSPTLTTPILNTPTLETPLLNTPTLVTPVLGTPTSGVLTNCTGLPITTGVSGLATNVAAFLVSPSSANLAAATMDETGSGALVFGTSPTLATALLNTPTLVTPVLGTPTSGVLTNCTGYTNANLPSKNIQISTSCGAFSGGAGAGPTDVTNLTVTITTTGRPVHLALISDGSANESYLMPNTGGTGTIHFYGGASGTTYLGKTKMNSPASNANEYAVSSCTFIDFPAAGTYIYKIRYSNTAANFSILYCKLVAYEL
jgi:hypothetical protein